MATNLRVNLDSYELHDYESLASRTNKHGLGLILVHVYVRMGPNKQHRNQLPPARRLVSQAPRVWHWGHPASASGPWDPASPAPAASSSSHVEFRRSSSSSSIPEPKRHFSIQVNTTADQQFEMSGWKPPSPQWRPCMVNPVGVCDLLQIILQPCTLNKTKQHFASITDGGFIVMTGERREFIYTYATNPWIFLFCV